MSINEINKYWDDVIYDFKQWFHPKDFIPGTIPRIIKLFEQHRREALNECRQRYLHP